MAEYTTVLLPGLELETKTCWVNNTNNKDLLLYMLYQHLRDNFTMTWTCSSGGGLGKYFEIFLVARSSSLSCNERLFSWSSRLSGIFTFHSLMSFALILAKVCALFLLIMSLSLQIVLLFSMSTSKAFANVSPSRRQMSETMDRGCFDDGIFSFSSFSRFRFSPRSSITPSQNVRSSFA